MIDKTKIKELSQQVAQQAREKGCAAWVWYKKQYKGRPWWRKGLVAVATFFALLFTWMGMVDVNFLWLFGRSPGFIDGFDPQISQASEVYSEDGELIGRFFSENRTPIKYEDVNPIFWTVLVDTEDERFYHHFGVDPLGMFSAAKDALFHQDARGASTLTQQLAKNMFKMRSTYSQGLLGHIPGLHMLIIKTKEWIVAMKLEMKYSKQDIITMYANTVDFGSNSFGIKTASKTYFNTTPAKLTVEQSAVLVGMLKATTYYNPILHPDNAFKRRNVVLKNVLKNGNIEQSVYDSLITIPIDLMYNVEGIYDGLAPHFRRAVADELKEWCSANHVDLYNDGLRIYTSLDSRMQKYAENAVAEHMKQLQKNFNAHWGNLEPWSGRDGRPIRGFVESVAKTTPAYKHLKARFPNSPDSVEYYLNQPHRVRLFDYDEGTIVREMSTMDSIRYMLHFMHCGFIAMEPHTGNVKAWVGDIDFNSWQYDKVTSRRQPGSTFKLFVYTEAMNQGLTPCDKRRDEFFSMQSWDPKQGKAVVWAPSNANGYFTNDSMPLKNAFAQSVNSVAVRLGQEMGIHRIIETARKMGITSPLDNAPSLALGVSDVSLYEMATAYSTVMDDGRRHKPRLIQRIEDKDGNTIYQTAVTSEQAIPYRSAFFMQRLLYAGTHERGGTSGGLNGYVGQFNDIEFGGKTGTTNGHSDAWFMGVSPRLVVGAWVGGEYRSIHFRTSAYGQGARAAMPLCGRFLKQVLSDPAFKEYHVKFPAPRPEITADQYQCSYIPAHHLDSVITAGLLDSILDDSGDPILDDLNEIDELSVPESTGPAPVSIEHFQK